MAITKLFSFRQKENRGELPDTYQYKVFPDNLKVQVVHIIQDAIGYDGQFSSNAKNLYSTMVKTLCREYGLFRLIDRNNSTPSDHFLNYFLQEDDLERSLDVVEIAFQNIKSRILQSYEYRSNVRTLISPDDAVQELNQRFKIAGFGYKFESGIIIKISSEFTHTEIVKPALSVLNDKRFKGAENEFLSAHEHYRNKRYKESLNECLKSFESVLKTICQIRKYTYSSHDTAKKLIETLVSNNYFPSYMQNQISNLRSILESGIPTIRNKNSGHGQGEKITTVNESLVEYALHLTASNILFLFSEL